MRDVNDYNTQQVHDSRLLESIQVGALVKVLSFDKKKMTVNVQPISKHLEHGKYESQPPILQVPVALTHCGGFIFRPWFKKGDIGTVLYIDHNIDATVSKGDEVDPLTERNHSPNDAIFVGALITGSYQAPGIPDNSIVLSSEDGASYVAVSGSSVTIKTGTVDIIASGAVTIKGSSISLN